MSKNNKSWSAKLAPFKKSDNLRAALEFLVTAIPLGALWAGMWSMLQLGSIAGVIGYFVLLIPAAALMVRLFILQHDCGHDSLFSSKKKPMTGLADSSVYLLLLHTTTGEDCTPPITRLPVIWIGGGWAISTH